MLKMESPQVSVNAMADQNVVGGKSFKEVPLDIFQPGRNSLQHLFCHTAVDCVVVDNKVVRFDQRVIADVSIEVEQGDPGQLLAPDGVHHLTVKSEDLADVVVPTLVLGAHHLGLVQKTIAGDLIMLGLVGTSTDRRFLLPATIPRPGHSSEPLQLLGDHGQRLLHLVPFALEADFPNTAVRALV